MIKVLGNILGYAVVIAILIVVGYFNDWSVDLVPLLSITLALLWFVLQWNVTWIVAGLAWLTWTVVTVNLRSR